jgi:replicative DNA helicase
VSRDVVDDDLIPLGVVIDGQADARARIAEEVYRAEKRRVREPPHVTLIERAVVATIIECGKRAVICCEEVGLSAADFYDEAVGNVYAAAVAVHARGAALSITSIIDQLARVARLDASGGPLVVAAMSERDAYDLIESLETRDGIDELITNAKLVIEHAQRRRVIEACRRAVGMAHAGAHDAATILDETMRTLAAVEAGTDRKLADNATIAHALSTSLPAFGGKRHAVPTGFTDVDHLLQGGLVPGDLIILAGRPSMGKTELALNVCEKRCLDHRRPALFFSLEMGADQLHTRIAGGRARVNPMREGVPRQMANRLSAALAELADSRLLIDETPGLTVGQLRATARAVRRQHPIELIVVDYLQLLSVERAFDNKATEVGEISKALKQLARELRLPVVALSQLNRGVESRADKRPLMSDLRESGALEQDADVIAFLYREEYYLKDATPGNKIGVAELIIAKHRNGPTGVAHLHFGRHERDPLDAPPRFGSLTRTT